MLSGDDEPRCLGAAAAAAPVAPDLAVMARLGDEAQRSYSERSSGIAPRSSSRTRSRSVCRRPWCSASCAAMSPQSSVAASSTASHCSGSSGSGAGVGGGDGSSGSAATAKWKRFWRSACSERRKRVSASGESMARAHPSKAPTERAASE